MRTRFLALVGALALGASLLTLTTPTTAAGIPGCTNADLAASYRHADNAAGHVYGWIVLRNRSSHACRTGGFPGVSYVGNGNGTQIGAPADRFGSWQVYTLAPGQRLQSLIDEVRAANYPRSTCRPRPVDGFRVYVPNSFRSQFVAHPTTGCANPAVHLMTLRSLRRP